MKFADRVRETSTSVGTGSFVVNGLPANFSGQRFRDAFEVGDVIPYCIEHGEVWELGIGRYIATDTFDRVTVLRSSEGGATRVTFANGAKQVFSGPIADLLSRVSQLQEDWFIDWNEGDDANSGEEGFPIRSVAEFLRRTDGKSRLQVMRLRLLAAVHPENVGLDVCIEPDNEPEFYNCRVEVWGLAPEVVFSGTMSNVQNWSPIVPSDGRIDCTDMPEDSWTESLGSLVGKFVVPTTGALVGYYMIPIADKEGAQHTLQVSFSTDRTGFVTTTAMQNGDEFNTIALQTQITGHWDVSVSGLGFLFFNDLIIGSPVGGSHQISCYGQRVQFNACYVYGCDLARSSVAFNGSYVYGLRAYDGCDFHGIWGSVVAGSFLAYSGKIDFVNSVTTCTLNIGDGITATCATLIVEGSARGLACVDVGLGIFIGIGGKASTSSRIWGVNIANSLVQMQARTDFFYGALLPVVSGPVASGAFRIGDEPKAIEELPYTNPTNGARAGGTL